MIKEEQEVSSKEELQQRIREKASTTGWGEFLFLKRFDRDQPAELKSGTGPGKNNVLLVVVIVKTCC